MKALKCIPLALTLLIAPLFAAPQTVSSEIDQVTVFPGRAQITRVATAVLSPGQHELIFENLPVSAADASFHAAARGTGEITFLGLSYRTVQHLEAQQERVAELENQIRSIENEQKEPLNYRIEVLETQKEFLLTIGKTGSEQLNRDFQEGKVDVGSWEAAYTFFGRQLAAVSDSLRISRQRLQDIESQLALLKSELQSNQVGSSRSTKSVEIGLQLAQAATVEVSLDYVVPNASWSPLYDARLNADDSVDLSCYAEVAQQTGEDWNNVDLTLSTARPAEGITPGDLAPWLLAIREFVQPYAEMSGAVHVRGGRAQNVVAASQSDFPILDALGAPADVLTAGIQDDLANLSTVFVVKRKMVIQSGAEAVRAPIDQWTLNADMKLVSRPRNRANVYRFATLTNQEQAPLLPGNVNVFAGADFLGTTAITGLIAPGEKFDLPFGVDNNVAVKREIISRKKDNGGDNQSVQETVRITIINHGKLNRRVTLEEPLPLSMDDRVKVKLGSIEPEPDSKDAQSKATWIIQLAANAETTILIPYKIEYPQGVLVSGL